MTSAYKRPPAEKSSKKPAPESERKVTDEGLKRKQEEIEVKESKKPKSVIEEKISEVEEVKMLRPFHVCCHGPPPIM
ncbi:hypothetical protein TIFTF001_003547 [Ficus carica]|uniref:Uncharacterized protein n=1 Tax=Ficus carica TaxID=3494 RepID=A0AA87ZU10_FICCA|nr:hypothetical protein TIFTF001_003547 [Ficus carica]